MSVPAPARPAAPLDRGARLDRLAEGTFDVVVIGAGVIGAATALAAASAGARVAVIDRGDVAGATSSASSKLLHGGLRYLGNGQIGLVREAHRERWLNATVVAPHLVRPLTFLLSIGPESPRRRTVLRAGVVMYSLLSRFRDGRAGGISAEAARALVPDLEVTDRRFVRYFDHQTDDARLTLAALRTAEAYGAVWLNHAEVLELRIDRGRVSGAEVRDRFSGQVIAVDGRVVVNATGPWVDQVRRLEDPAAEPSVRLSKGIHLIYACDEPWRAAVTTPLPEGRVSFAIPWQGMVLLGTTDEPFEGPPETVSVDEADRVQVLGEAAGSLVHAALGPDRERYAFAGLRVLPLGQGGTAGAHRETVITRGRGGMLSVAGGKLTTWRRIGLTVAQRALEEIGGPAPSTTPVPLVGAADPSRVATQIAAGHPLSGATSLHLARTYGSLAGEVLAPALEDDRLYEPVVAGSPEILAQIPYAVRHEGACTRGDVLRRRTTIAIRGLSDDALPRIDPYLEVPAAA